jgi:4-hydroxy-tetrahydrodipicolinate reductase
MKIALLGYGKMGKEIEQIALAKGHTIVLKVTEHNADSLTDTELSNADVAIEFSTPHTAYDNILRCFKCNVPIVVGTTGWLDKLNDVKEMCAKQHKALFYASNYSIGVNIFFELNKYMAQIMNKYAEYNVIIDEIHHTQKLDSPSGTALTLANDIIQTTQLKRKWINETAGTKIDTINKEELLINSIRTENVPGTHTIKYESVVDTIEITHIAHSRKGFASGAVLAAEWIIGKKGIFSMEDLMKTSK